MRSLRRHLGTARLLLARSPRRGIGTALSFLVAAALIMLASQNLDARKTHYGEMRERWLERIHAVGVEQAYGEFAQEYGARDAQQQHGIIHLFGGILYERFGTNGLRECRPEFGFGCYHGFLIAAIGTLGLNAIPDLNAFCRTLAGPSIASCQHGIGHGVLRYFGPSRLLDALSVCAKVPPIHPYINCTLGVFMEHVTMVSRDLLPPVAERQQDKPYAPCLGLPEQFRAPCAYHLAGRWEVLERLTYPQVSERCAAMASAQEVEACFRGMGYTAAPASNFNAPEIITHCQAIRHGDGAALCQETAAEAFAAEPAYRSSAALLCARIGGEREQECRNRFAP